MLGSLNKSLRKVMIASVLSVFALSMVAAGQDADPSQNPAPAAPAAPAAPGWHRFSPPPQAPPPQAAPPAAPQQPQPQPQATPVPDHITIPAGTFLTVRVDQFLSSDKNKAGDGFSATLARPLVSDGLVVSQRG